MELADGSHHRARVPLRFRLTSRLKQGVDAPSQHLLPVEVGAFYVVMDLTPSLLDQPVGPCDLETPQACRAYATQAVSFTSARISSLMGSTRS